MPGIGQGHGVRARNWALNDLVSKLISLRFISPGDGSPKTALSNFKYSGVRKRRHRNLNNH
jgi:hypothetical protein